MLLHRKAKQRKRNSSQNRTDSDGGGDARIAHLVQTSCVSKLFGFFFFSSLDRKKEQREGGGKVSVDTARGVARHAHSILRRERLPL